MAEFSYLQLVRSRRPLPPRRRGEIGGEKKKKKIRLDLISRIERLAIFDVVTRLITGTHVAQVEIPSTFSNDPTF